MLTMHKSLRNNDYTLNRAEAYDRLEYWAHLLADSRAKAAIEMLVRDLRQDEVETQIERQNKLG